MTFVPINSVNQLAERVRDAQQHNTPVYPYAGNTQQHQLAPASQTGLTVNLSGLNQLIDYPHQDLTITVQAGMTIDTLQKLLFEKQQTLPIDAPRSHEATVGGSIAANINGPRRTGWGTWRDYLIGFSWINDKGEEAKAGGRVVKNVAGYDFCKLFTGSFGTLGIITQVTLKVKPLPEKCALVSGFLKSSDLGTFIELLRHSRLRPSVFVVNPEQEPGGVSPRSALAVNLAFEDSATAVDWQIEHLREISQQLLSEIGVISGVDANMEINERGNFALAGQSITFQSSVPTSRCAEFATQAQSLVASLQAQPAVGIVTGHLPANVSIDDATEIINQLRTLAVTVGGHLTLPRCPNQWRTALQPFGPSRPDWSLMRKIKQAMDPNNIFQRGRYEILQGE